MEFKERIEQRPVTVTVAEQIETALVNYSGAAVILVPTGANGNMDMFYRSGTHGAWWKVCYSSDKDKSFRLSELLEDITTAVLIAREDVDRLLDGTVGRKEWTDG